MRSSTACDASHVFKRMRAGWVIALLVLVSVRLHRHDCYRLGSCGDAGPRECARTATGDLGRPYRLCAWGTSVLGTPECRADFGSNTTVAVCQDPLQP